MFPGLFALLIALVGTWATLDAWRRYRRDVLRWPTAPGRILDRSVREAKERVRSPGSKRWEPVVRYAYEARGQTHEGRNVYLPWPALDTREACERFVQGLPDEIAVRYDPASPATSVLFPAPLTWTLWLLAGCLMALLVSLILLVTS